MVADINKNYIEVLQSLKEKIKQARQKAALAVNKELLLVYWEIGNTISLQQKSEGWGTKVIDRLAADLKTEFPDFKGLSVRNLKYMKAFAEAYPDFIIVQPPAAQLQQHQNQSNIIVQPLVAQIPWAHHIVLLNKIPSKELRVFYIKKTAENGWSKSVLAAQIESQLHLRQGKAITNFEQILPKAQSDLARETLKNPYVFDFLGLSEEMQERELEKSLMLHIKNFLLELGRGFAYVGNQFNIVIEDDDYFLDLLFYNYHLHCFVVFELKIGKFKPEYAGKLNFYINTVDEQIKSTDHKPTIGVLLCKTPNQTVVKYALKGIKTPIGVADYEFAKALPKNLKSELPSIAELEAALDNEAKKFESPLHKKIKAVLTKQPKAIDKKKKENRQ
jgi:predicted nuclease of restriction endonuclease-like (RecB) superfamily